MCRVRAGVVSGLRWAWMGEWRLRRPGGTPKYERGQAALWKTPPRWDACEKVRLLASFQMRAGTLAAKRRCRIVNGLHFLCMGIDCPLIRYTGYLQLHYN